MITRTSVLLSCWVLAFAAGAQKYEWASAFDSDSYNQSLAIASDTNGNVVTTGFFFGTVDFDPGPGNAYLNAVSPSGAFVSKLDADGHYVWALQFGGGISSGAGLDVVTDHSGNVYFCGSFSDTVDFDPGPGVFQLISISEDAFVCKLSLNGDLIWAKQFKATTGTRTAIALEVDDQQNCFVGGKFSATTDFDPGNGVFNLTSSGGTDIFISKLNAAGDLVWAKRIGSTQDDQLRALDLDNAGNIYSTGSYAGTADFDPGSGTFSLGAQLTDIFVLKLTNNGDFIWAKKMGGSQVETGACLKVDRSSNVYTIGQFKGSVDFDPGSGVMTFSAGANFDAFVQKLDSSGNFLWAKKFGSTSDDSGRGLDVDSLSNVYITGEFMGTVDFETGPNVWAFSTPGGLNDRDVYICKLDSNGVLKWPKHIGGTGASDLGQAICADNHANVYTTGTYMHTVDMNTGQGIALFTSENSLEMFVHKLSPCDITYHSVSVTHCGNYTSPSGDHVWSGSGTYTDVVTNAAGCDSVITISLTVLPLPTRTTTVAVCSSYISPSGNHTWSASGTYYDTLPNAVGCDSLIVVQLTVLQTIDTLTVDACDTYTSPGGNVWTSSGYYTDTLTQINGCDSIVTTYLTIPQLQTEITVSNDSILLSNGPAGATYQWLNCSDYSPIMNANSAVFTAAENGSYAVEITIDHCVDTSSCVTVANLSIDSEKTMRSITVFPNPTTGKITIHNREDAGTTTWSLSDARGVVLQTGNTHDAIFEIVVTGDPGLYVLKVTFQTGREERIPFIRR